ncbi:MFS transporter [Actinomycetaceae bacterium L2_0104]
MSTSEREFLSPADERLLKWLSVGLISLIAFETLAVATAMPTVVGALDGMNLYALAMGVVMATQLMTTALAGPWSDHRSPQSCLYTGIAGFTAGLVLCTLAPNMYVFVLGRAVQGLGAGLCVVPLYTLVGNNVRPVRQPSFFAAFAAAWVLPALVGPAIAGFIVQHMTWRVVFGLVPAILLVAFPLLVNVTRKIPHHASPADNSRIRVTVFCAFAAGIFAAILQVMSGTDSSDFSADVYAVIAVSALATFLFMKPLLPRGTFRARRGLASTVLLRGLIHGAFVGVEAFLPLMLQVIHGWDPFQAGLVLTVGSVTWAIGSAAQGRIVDPERRRRIPVIGALIQFVGVAATIVGTFEEVSGLVVIAGWTIAGLGIGFVYPAMTVHGLSMSAPENQGRTSSSLQMADTLGAATAVAAAGIVYAIILPAQSAAFAGAIGAMAFVMMAAFVVAHRVQPIPGSREEAQMRQTFTT